MADVIVQFCDGTTGYLNQVHPYDGIDTIVADLIAGRDGAVAFADTMTHASIRHRTGDIREITIRL